jgi:hypothetical protein
MLSLLSSYSGIDKDRIRLKNVWLIWYENLALGFPSYTVRSTEDYGGRPHDGDLHAVF